MYNLPGARQAHNPSNSSAIILPPPLDPSNKAIPLVAPQIVSLVLRQEWTSLFEHELGRHEVHMVFHICLSYPGNIQILFMTSSSGEQALLLFKGHSKRLVLLVPNTRYPGTESSTAICLRPLPAQ